ncbi:MAG: hypothetical protein Rubg2KO_35570 [Rubricoccaceae bacterium]
MSTTARFFFAGCLMLVASATHAQTTSLMGHVHDAVTDDPVVGATVRVDGTTRGAAADADGHFMIELATTDEALVISAIGYDPVRLELPIENHVLIRLMPSTSTLDVVTVSGEQAVAGDPSVSTRTPATTDDLLAHLPGVSLIQRANFAWEPIVRGYSGGQVSLTVDGMPVYGACVDKMDPASSYVEPENLAAIEVSKGASDLSRGSQIGGSVDLVSERPQFNVTSAQGESGIETQGLARRVRGAINVGTDRAALRASASYRGAGDYAPGGGETIETSGYEKRNIALAGAVKLADGHTLTAQGIADDAWLVGYPALLMDATLAQARIGSVTYEGQAPGLHDLTARVYRNRVDHSMDDRFRDVMQRPVMRGMYMPMAGYTDVWGASTTAERMQGQRTHVDLTLDAHRLRQFGDMWMFSLFPGIQDMYLLNVGDARAVNASATLGAKHVVSDRLMLSASARLDVSDRDTHRDEVKSIFKARYGTDDLARQLVIPSVNASATVRLSPQTRVRMAVADAGRLPTLVEMYGHYVYNYVDGYFYTGRPDIRPERSRQLELGVTHASGRLAIEAAAYVHQLRDVVVGVADSVVTPGLSGSTYRFRLYENAEKGWMAGGEISGLLNLGSLLNGLEVAASASMTFGENVSFDEPLPMIPPPSGVVALRYDRRPWFGELESRWAFPQNRVARITFDERVTDGFNVLALRAGWRPTGPVSVQAGVENLLDTFYQEHLAISDLAARGRSAYVAVGFDL